MKRVNEWCSQFQPTSRNSHLRVRQKPDEFNFSDFMNRLKPYWNVYHSKVKHHDFKSELHYYLTDDNEKKPLSGLNGLKGFWKSSDSILVIVYFLTQKLGYGKLKYVWKYLFYFSSWVENGQVRTLWLGKEGNFIFPPFDDGVTKDGVSKRKCCQRCN